MTLGQNTILKLFGLAYFNQALAFSIKLYEQMVLGNAL